MLSPDSREMYDDRKDYQQSRIMTVTKRVFIVISMTLVVTILYQWGQLDGRAGIVAGVIS